MEEEYEYDSKIISRDYSRFKSLVDKFNDEKDEKELESFHRQIASYYVKNPKLFEDLFEEDPDSYEKIQGYQKYIMSGCSNLQYERDDIIFYYDEVKKKLWCYNPKDWHKKLSEDSENYNPYTLEGIKREIKDVEPKRESIMLKRPAYGAIRFWSEFTYTLGKVFYKIRPDVAQDFARTLTKNKEYSLFRGMSFPDKKSFSEYLHKIKSDEVKSKGIVSFETFTSWTYDLELATDFSMKFIEEGGHGIILHSVFKADELLIDLTKIGNALDYYSEEEVIALPFKKQVDIVDYLSSGK